MIFEIETGSLINWNKTSKQKFIINKIPWNNNVLITIYWLLHACIYTANQFWVCLTDMHRSDHVAYMFVQKHT